jgi:hypothetical protein
LEQEDGEACQEPKSLTYQLRSKEFKSEQQNFE